MRFRRLSSPIVRLGIIGVCLAGPGVGYLACSEADTGAASFVRSSAEHPRHLEQGTPEAVGMNAQVLEQSAQLITQAISDQAIRGAVLLVARHGKVVFHRALGQRDGNLSADPSVVVPPGPPGHPDLQPDPSAPMSLGAIFDLESMTKPFTASLALAMDADQIRFPGFSIHDPLSKYWPPSSPMPEALAVASVRDLMRFASGHFIDAAQFMIEDPHPWVTMYQEAPVYPPGQDTIYSDLSYRLLGNILEGVGGDTLQSLWAHYFFVPMDMSHTASRPAHNLPDKHALIAGTAYSKIRGYYLRGEVQDEQDFHIEQQIHPLHNHLTHTGCDGIFSSAWDLALFGQMLLNQGKHVPQANSEPIQILPKESVVAMLGTQTADIANPHVPTPTLNDSVVYNDKGYGWEKGEAGAWPGGTTFGPLSVSKTGGAGTIMVLHPELDLMYILLTNHGLPSYDGIVADPSTLKLDWPSFTQMLAAIKTRELGQLIVEAVERPVSG